MDLFTYLMAKNGNNTSVHGDLFSYLLGKGQSQTQTISGITIYIPNAKKLVNFMMTKESTQDGTPTPENPVPVNVVEGYRNLFDKDNATIGYRLGGDGLPYADTNYVLSDFIEVIQDNTYTFHKVGAGGGSAAICYYTNTKEFISRTIWQNGVVDTRTFTIPSNANYIRVTDTKNLTDTIQIVDGDQVLPYVPYGNNYVNVTVSDGNTTNNYPIPLNNNELVGIGDYKDELLIDKSGHVFINKKTGKIVLDGTEEWQYYNGIQYIISISDYKLSGSISMCPYYQSQDNITSTIQMLNNHIAFRNESNNPTFYVKDTRFNNTTDFKTWLGTHNTDVYYVLAQEELIDLQTTVDLSLFKGENTITNSEEANMTIEYK